MRWIALVAFLSACAHTRVRYVDGCWIKEHKNRIGDTTQEIAVCEPKPPDWSQDPVARSVEACMYQSQVTWYNDALQRFRTKDERPAGADWAQTAKRCLGDAQRLQQKKIDQLAAELSGEKSRADHLESENAQLRDTIVACVEKQPNAIATATSTSGSDSTAEHTTATAGNKKVTSTSPSLELGTTTPTGMKIEPAAATPGGAKATDPSIACTKR